MNTGNLNALSPPDEDLDTRVSRAVWRACVEEVVAMNPGNVSIYSSGHGMTAEDFLASARAAAGAIGGTTRGVGERVLAAVRATQQTVGCNTNLGIVLLCAPLVHAVLCKLPGRGLEKRVRQVLAKLDRIDADQVYRAIRLAQPGGLGTSLEHDVRDPPRVTLLEAMRVAAHRDRIAWQYAHGFADIFGFAVPRMREAISRWGDRDWAVIAVYLALLARFPDTHVERKFGHEKADLVRVAAKRFATELWACGHPRQMLQPLREFDAELKRDGINPGTTADLTVAAALAIRLDDLAEAYYFNSPTRGGVVHKTPARLRVLHQPDQEKP